MNKIDNIKNKNIKYIVLGICILILISIAINISILQSSIRNFDDIVYKQISQFISPTLTNITKIVTIIGSAYVIIPICIIMSIIFWKKIESILILLNLIIIFILNQIMKVIIARPRPIEYRLIEEHGYSFPSGHAMISTAFYGFLIYLIYKKVNNKYIKWSSIIVLSMLILLIGTSRIYLGVHYASDVLAGFIISIVYLIIFTNIIKEKIE